MTHLLNLFTDDPLGLFRTSVTATFANTTQCQEVLDTNRTFEAFKVDLVLNKDTPDDITGAYTVTLVATVSHWTLVVPIFFC